MAGRFGAVLTAMVTPFREDGSLDLERAGRLAAWLREHGTDGLVVHGSTGEAATLSDQEKLDLVRAVKRSVPAGTPVIAGTGTYDTRHTIELGERAAEAGADALLVVSPYYSKPPQRGLLAHFRAVAQATELPVILYNIPGRTAVRIEHSTLLELAGVDNIVAVKDSTGDVEAVSRLAAEAPSGFEIYCGDDALTLPMVCMGAVGVVSVAAHLVGDRLGQMIELATSGDVPGARKIHESLLGLFKALFVTSNPIPVKAALEMAGQPVGSPRLPLVAASDDERAVIRKALEDVGVL